LIFTKPEIVSNDHVLLAIRVNGSKSNHIITWIMKPALLL
jgi:hypothetical protein